MKAPLAKRVPGLAKTLLRIPPLLRGAQHILLISGDNPDGDSLGTMAALYPYCLSFRKKVTCFCVTDIPKNLNFLTLPQLVKNKDGLDTDIDVVITFDLGSLRQTGLTDWLAKRSITIINVDHHQTNDYFGAINAVSTKAASTTEIVYTLFKEVRFPIDKQTATVLLTGLLTDTGNLGNPATSVSAMAMAADLVKRGAGFKKVLEHTYRNKSLAALKLWGLVITDIAENKILGISTAIVSHEDVERFGANETLLDGLANFLTVIGDTRAIMVLREVEPGTIKGSLRTTRDDVNVEALAVALGGGGHRKAAGFTVSGTLEKRNASWYIR